VPRIVAVTPVAQIAKALPEEALPVLRCLTCAVQPVGVPLLGDGSLRAR